MQANKASLAPRQKRSARTEDKLLEAAARVLDRDGLEGTTVPRIAAEAKLSPAGLYRRFADKDDLLRWTLLRMLETAHAQGVEQLQTLRVRDTLGATAEALIGTLLGQSREHPQLLRALRRMIEVEPESPFAIAARERLAASLAESAKVLLAHRDSIRHPDPERAVRFAVLSAASAIDLVSLNGHSLWHMALPLSEKAFTAELARGMVAYLRRKP